MKLTDAINSAITRRMQEVNPQSFYAKVKALTTSDYFSPRLTEQDARSLLAQRKRKPKRKHNPYACDPARVSAYQQKRSDLYG